jgi:hypothetical protein
MPYTTLVAGTTILSSWANASVRDQSVTPFASESARTSAISSPVTGMISYTTDCLTTWHYNGTAWAIPNTLYARKTADQTVTNSTTLVNDTHLVLPVAANRTYEIRATMIFDDGAGVGRFKAGWSGPAGATLDWVPDGTIETNTGNPADVIYRIYKQIGDTQGIGGVGGTPYSILLISGLLITSATAGNLQFRWAQFQADGTGTILRAGSWLIGQVVG